MSNTLSQDTLKHALEQHGYQSLCSIQLPDGVVAYQGSLGYRQRICVVDRRGLPGWPIYRTHTENDPVLGAVRNLLGRQSFISTGAVDAKQYIKSKQERLFQLVEGRTGNFKHE